MVGFCVGIDLFRCSFQCFKMRLWIAITEGMVRDDGEAGFKESLEFGVHEVEISNFKSQISMRIK